ncbi:Uncharacterised protein [Mycobacterium tuberculosis]|nr:Uncharacterised protein [Mycobacterium tuberculosis]
MTKAVAAEHTPQARTTAVSVRPAPKRARYKVCALVTKAVAAEHTPQARTTAVSVRPAPKRANAALAGTWNRT